MGQSKNKKLIAFPEDIIKAWEDDDCVNFAIALSRLTNWLLHVDWFTDSRDPESNEDPSEMVPIRVYVADNLDNIFDVRGIKKIKEFTEGTIQRVARNRVVLNGGIKSRFYKESDIFDLPLRKKPNEEKIAEARIKILENTEFLSKIPKRAEGLIPAYEASQFTFGWCSCYADALSDITGLPTCALLATKYVPMFQASPLGYIHSFVLHPDGNAEDAWGIQTVEDMAKRFGAIKYETDLSMHDSVSKTHKTNSADKYIEGYNKAKALIKAYRN